MTALISAPEHKDVRLLQLYPFFALKDNMIPQKLDDGD